MARRQVLGALAMRAAWLAVAVALSMGAAGIASAMNQPPGSSARPELTAPGDAELRPALETGAGELLALADEVDALAEVARRALTLLPAGDVERLEAAVTEGTLRLGAIETATRELQATLATIPSTGDDWPLHVSAALHDRYLALEGTPALAMGLEDDWAVSTSRSLAAARLTSLLARHDEETAAAARLGSQGRYAAALDGLDDSDRTIAQARDLAADLASTTDTDTLDAWLDRNADYDAALRDLYATLVKTEGRVTDAVRKAIDREQAARARLPGDTRALVVIMGDIAQGGLNQAVIAIEEARGSLAEAIERQEELRAGESLPE